MLLNARAKNRTAKMASCSYTVAVLWLCGLHRYFGRTRLFHFYFDPDIGSRVFVCNVGMHSGDCTVQESRKQHVKF
jgi:hypothetical protein